MRDRLTDKDKHGETYREMKTDRDQDTVSIEKYVCSSVRNPPAMDAIPNISWLI